MRDIRNAALIAVETKRAGHSDRELLNRMILVVSSSLTVILRRSSWSENLEKRDKEEVIGKTFIRNIMRIDDEGKEWPNPSREKN